MPRPRKSHQELNLSGQLAKNGKRYESRAAVPQPNGALGDPHPSLTPEQASIWREVQGSAPDGVLQKSDRTCVEIVVRLLAKSRAGQAKPAETTLLASLLAKCGLTPTDRNRIFAAPAPREQDSAWDRFAKSIG